MNQGKSCLFHKKEMKIVLDIITSQDFKEKYLDKIINRGKASVKDVNSVVSEIISKVKANGDGALIEYTEKFDGAKLRKEDLVVTEKEIKDAYNSVDESFVLALKQAITNIKKFHEAQLRDKWFIETEKGVKVGQIMRPYEKIGVYIPGGRAPYPSTVLMGAVPAKVAGVKEIYLATPPDKEGKINPAILVAANEVKITKIFKVGGAQAIAALAYGTETINPVDKIVGPGNVYVMTAKILVSNDVRIDLPAGPSEVLIIADDTANSSFIATDILAQAEHDPDSCCYLLTTSEEIAQAVLNEIGKTFEYYKRKEIIGKVLENNLYVALVKDIPEAIKLSNKIAPEHLEIQIRDPESVLDSIENAGAIFLGNYSPVAIGDYSAGSNHVLPTGGLARIYSGLSILDYVKVIDVVNASKEGLKNIKNSVITLAEKEGLEVHAKSVSKRLED